jgi:hypothetical protein
MKSVAQRKDRSGTAGQRRHLSVVRLDDKRTIGCIFRNISKAGSKHQNLRRKIFRQIAKNVKLQEIILDVLARNSKAQLKMIAELATVPQLRRELLALAHDGS